MKLDQLITQRFEELERRAQGVSEAKEVDFQGNGKVYYNIPYPSFTGWATSALNLLQRAFGEESVHYQKLSQLAEISRGGESAFESCRAVFLAAKEDYEGGYLFNVRSLVKAEVLSDALDQAKELLSAGYKDPACVLAGVSLEVALKDLCDRHGIAHSKLDKMNADLAKAAIYNTAKQKQITAWADLRNKAAHGDWSAYSDADIDDLVNGVERFIGDFL